MVSTLTSKGIICSNIGDGMFVNKKADPPTKAPVAKFNTTQDSTPTVQTVDDDDEGNNSENNDDSDHAIGSELTPIWIGTKRNVVAPLGRSFINKGTP